MGETPETDERKVPYGKAVEPAGRVCTSPDCTTILSVYNVSDRCGRHPRNKIPPPRQRSRR